jgi:glycosyltransferase involved in cell wall biosynthesis
MPRVSILIPLHNCESTIRRSLDSVYAQDFEDFEIIAILNNCTDNTESILLEYSDRKQPIKTFYCKVPGIVPTLNTGIPHCTGEFIARQDGDDMWYPTKLRKQVEFLDANSNIDIVGTQMRQVNAEGKPIQASLVHPTEDLQIKSKLLSGNNAVVHPTVLFRKEIFLRAGTYDGHYRFAEDYHFWLKCCKWYHFANLDEVLLDYTVWHNEEYDPTIVHHVKNIMNYLYENTGFEHEK